MDNFPAGVPPISEEPVTIQTDTSNTPVADSSQATVIQNSNSSNKKSRKGGIIATMFGILLLVGAVGAGLVLVNQNQQINQHAAGLCSDICADSGSCAGRGGSWTPVTLSNPNGHPECAAQGGFCAGGNNCSGGGGGSGSNWTSSGNCINVTSGSVSLQRFNGSSCPTNQNGQAIEPNVGIGTYCTTPSAGSCQQLDVVGSGNGVCSCQAAAPTPTPTPSPSPSPTPLISASCTNIGVYDTNWNQLTAAQLTELTPGTKVNFTVIGATNGTFDSARFTINGTLESPVSTTKPGDAATYYTQYTIPTGVTSFTVKAELHQVQLNEWF